MGGGNGLASGATTEPGIPGNRDFSRTSAITFLVGWLWAACAQVSVAPAVRRVRHL